MRLRPAQSPSLSLPTLICWEPEACFLHIGFYFCFINKFTSPLSFLQVPFFPKTLYFVFFVIMKVCWPFLIPFCSFSCLSHFLCSFTYFSSLLALYRYGNQLCYWLYLVSHKEFSSQEGQTRVYGCIRQIHSTYIKAGAKKPMQNSCSTSVGIVISWHTTHIPLMFAIYLFSHMCSTWHPSSLTRDGAHVPYKGSTEP